MDLTAQLTLSLAEHPYANPRRMHLLACIVESGSLSGGAKRAEMSYKAAWDAVNDMNTRAAQPVLTLAVGGKGGGGAKLTPFGERLVKLYQMLSDIQNRALQALQDETVPLDSLLGAVSLFSAQNSARNQLLGRVSRIVSDQVNDRVSIDVQAGEASVTLVAEVTHRSRLRLDLHPFGEVLVLIKAPAICLQRPSVSAAANHLSATIVRVSGSDHEAEVILAIGSIELCAVVNVESANEWQVGQKVTVVIDAKQIVLAALRQ
ncbi:TOBE domain-containing protein [Amphritea sp.]|uniref:TOBE domain-containing protein n=1 Tax=Amphritea sp. TaxID=1872502 RepID=UPI003A8D108E